MATSVVPAATVLVQDPTAPVAVVPTPNVNSSLYVGDLERDVTESQLYDTFSQVGPVASIRVCRDAVTRRSLGYAYVNYNSALDPSAAERALENLNYSLVNGKPIRIMWSHRDPAHRRSGVGNIFIKNLDKSIDNKSLHLTFSGFGRILSCKVAMDMSGQSKGYGFVQFETDEAAQLAIQKVNGMMIEEKIVCVCAFLKRAERPHGKDKFTNVFVKNLSPEVTDEELQKLAGEHGEATSVAVMKDDEGKSRGFGFVNFAEYASAASFATAMNGKPLYGREVFAGRAQKRSEREALLKVRQEEHRLEKVAKTQGMNLYVKNLADEVGDERLRAEFAPHGTITSCKVMAQPDGRSKGFGFVCYSSHEDAARAVHVMLNKMVEGKPLYVALAQSKEVRRASLEVATAKRLADLRTGPHFGPGKGPWQGFPAYPGAPPPRSTPRAPPVFPAGPPEFRP